MAGAMSESLQSANMPASSPEADALEPQTATGRPTLISGIVTSSSLSLTGADETGGCSNQIESSLGAAPVGTGSVTSPEAVCDAVDTGPVNVPVAVLLSHVMCDGQDNSSSDLEDIDATAGLDALVKEMGIQVNTSDTSFQARQQLLTISLIRDERTLTVVTGVSGFALFYNIVDLYTNVRLLLSTSSFCISNEDAVLMAFIKLCQNVSYSLVGVLFGTHRSTASNIFKEGVCILSKILESAIFWPAKESVITYLTKYF